MTKKIVQKLGLCFVVRCRSKDGDGGDSNVDNSYVPFVGNWVFVNDRTDFGRVLWIEIEATGGLEI
jgi:hypothetical protein